MREVRQLRYYKQRTVRSISPDRYAYTRRNWFSDLLWKGLWKLGCISHPYDEREETSVATFKAKDIADAVLRQMRSMERNYIRPTHVYMSNEVFEELIYEPRYQHMGYLTFNIDLRDERGLFGVPVTIVPHMTGILVI